jgi:DNA-binding GntR family transcriptional regulator
MADATSAQAGLAPLLAERIVAWLRAERLAAGAQLTEQALADRFQVSRSPVRAALAALVDGGVLERRANRRLYLARDAAALPDAPAQVVLRVDDDAVYAAIAEDRLAGHLPERISEAALLRRYGLSRPHLLRLLGRMAQEGWIERRAGHGWTFLPMLTSADAYEDGYRFRALIEPQGLLEPRFHAPEAELVRLRQQQQALLRGGLRAMSRVELFQINAGFHEAVLAWSNNGFLLDGLRRVNRLRRLIEYRKFLDGTRLAAQVQEHVALLDLIEAGRLADASRFLRRHLDVVRGLKLKGGVARIDLGRAIGLA